MALTKWQQFCLGLNVLRPIKILIHSILASLPGADRRLSGHVPIWLTNSQKHGIMECCHRQVTQVKSSWQFHHIKVKQQILTIKNYVNLLYMLFCPNQEQAQGPVFQHYDFKCTVPLHIGLLDILVCAGSISHFTLVICSEIGKRYDQSWLNQIKLDLNYIVKSIWKHYCDKYC